MYHRSNWFFALLLSPLVAHAAMGGRSPIGLAVSSGGFTIDSVKATGTATVFDGDVIVTEGDSSRIHMKDGSEVEIYPHSTGTVYADHVELRAGALTGKMENRYQMRAGDFVVRAAEKDTRATVQLASAAVTVAVPSGRADVSTAGGVLLSHMAPGVTLSYATPTESGVGSRQVHLLGVLDRHGDHYLVRDRYTNLVSELVGTVPAGDANKLVSVTGEWLDTPSSVPQVDRMVRLERVERSTAAIGGPCLPDGAGGVAKRIDVSGLLSKDKEHFLVTTTDHGVVEVLGDVKESEVGSHVHLKAFVLENRKPYPPAEQLVYAEDRKFVVLDSPCAGLITSGVLITAGSLIALGQSGSAAVKPISF